MGFFTDMLNGLVGNNDSTASSSSSTGGFFSSLVSSFTGATQDVSQQIAFTKHIAASASDGAVYGMTQEEKFKLMRDAIEKCGAASTPNTALGEIYPLIIKRINEAEYNLSQPIAHETCPKECLRSREHCEECLQKRLAVLEALYYVDCPEEYKNRVSAAPKNAGRQNKSKCPLCGAPVEPSMKTCAYCDTVVSNVYDEAGAIFLSAAQAATPEQAAYDLIYPYQLEAAEDLASPETQKIFMTMSYAMAAEQRLELSMQGVYYDAELKKGLKEAFEKTTNLAKVKMSMSDLHYMANEYHLSVGQYLRCLFNGDPNIQTVALYRENARMEKEQEERKKQMERDRQANEERLERQRKANADFWRRHQQHAVNSIVHYAEHERTCYDCTYYSPAAQACAQTNRSTNARDYCGLWKLK